MTETPLHLSLEADLLEAKTLQLQELQHRIANNLQIIASLLLQSARKAGEGDTRAHLQDAHRRVMAVAAVQRHLAATQVGEVQLRDYLTTLCDGIGASMIGDQDRVSLTVEADDSVLGPEAAVSLGLIVTELVINALKHAFPDGRRGAVIVLYRADGSGWSLSVSDDGVGMSVAQTDVTPGLGTNIVQGLARSLRATVNVSDANPGVCVRIAHDAITPGGQRPPGRTAG